MNIHKLVVVSLIVGSAMQAGPAFDKALTESKLESKEHYIGRLELLALWLQAGLSACEGIGYGEIGALMSASRLKSLQNSLSAVMATLKFPWAIEALPEIQRELDFSVEIAPKAENYEKNYDAAVKNFNVYKKYYDLLNKKFIELGQDKAGVFWAAAKFPDFEMPQYNKYSLLVQLKGRERR